MKEGLNNNLKMKDITSSRSKDKKRDRNTLLAVVNFVDAQSWHTLDVIPVVF